jgi:uncharacterized membrane protein
VPGRPWRTGSRLAGLPMISRRILTLAFVFATLAWAGSLLAAPYVLTHAATGPLAARVAGLLYVAGGFICHQAPERSFHLWGVQLPVCARCLGLYAAAPLGAVLPLVPLRWTHGIYLRVSLRAALAITVLPTLLTIGIEQAGLASVSGWARAVSAAPLAVAVAWIASAAIRGHLR